MAGRNAFLIGGVFVLLVAIIILVAGSPLLAALLALVAAGLFWYAPRAGNPAR